MPSFYTSFVAFVAFVACNPFKFAQYLRKKLCLKSKYINYWKLLKKFLSEQLDASLPSSNNNIFEYSNKNNYEYSNKNIFEYPNISQHVNIFESLNK